jgi:hypothetical protein
VIQTLLMWRGNRDRVWRNGWMLLVAGQVLDIEEKELDIVEDGLGTIEL